MSLWEVQTPVHVAGGYEEGEPVHNGVTADWEAWLVYRRLSSVVPLQLQFSSIGVPKADAERLVKSVVDHLNQSGIWQ